MTSKQPKKSQKTASYHHGDLRAGLIDAATEIVEKDGVMALSLRGVARLAGVSQTAPYHHFTDKEALLAAVAETGFQGLSAEMEKAEHHRLGGGERMVALGRAYVSFATSNPGRFRLMFGPLIREKLNYPDLLIASSRSLQMIRAAVEQRRQDVGAKTGNVEADTMAAWSIVHGLATLLIDSGFNPESMGTATQDALVAHVTLALVSGLGLGGDMT
ncbi:TetR/AcrR family transcriptional regulator [Parvibaculaceae bacterium PLY_AMNH_Bact1]|nr:TetR/AcrR family transcriptional regulator [Parvibaculaceae bacterium PLY_AMNH_Bact1]